MVCLTNPISTTSSHNPNLNTINTLVTILFIDLLLEIEKRQVQNHHMWRKPMIDLLNLGFVPTFSPPWRRVSASLNHIKIHAVTSVRPCRARQRRLRCRGKVLWSQNRNGGVSNLEKLGRECRRNQSHTKTGSSAACWMSASNLAL